MKNMKWFLVFLALLAFPLFNNKAAATALSITNTTDSFTIGVPYGLEGGELVGDYSNDSILYVWDEVQNLTLTSDLYVNRVADNAASYVDFDGSNYYIKAGTIVSSHYVQWDPGNDTRVKATLNFDSDIFAFIISDSFLANSDSQLGLSSINYGDFTNRGLERGDTTNFNGGSVDINWNATSPGDWTRLITAYSPGGEVPVPTTILLLNSGLLCLVGVSRKKQHNFIL